MGNMNAGGEGESDEKEEVQEIDKYSEPWQPSALLWPAGFYNRGSKVSGSVWWQNLPELPWRW